MQLGCATSILSCLMMILESISTFDGRSSGNSDQEIKYGLSNFKGELLIFDNIISSCTHCFSA
jgi:hypothetical protein